MVAEKTVALQEEFLADDFILVENAGEQAGAVSYNNIPNWRDILNRFLKNRGSVIAVFVIVFIVAMAVVGPNLNVYEYDTVNTSIANLPPRIPVLENFGIFDGSINGVDRYELKGVSDEYYWFGTDTLGRDLWTRVWKGTRVSLIIAAVAALGNLVIGVLYGMVSGYMGGRVDLIMQRIVEVLHGIPSLVIMTLLLLILSPGMGAIIVALLITGWVGMSRLVRGQTIKLKSEEYILASRTLGSPIHRILFKKVLPNITGQIIVLTMFSIPDAIFAESFLAFIGLGLPTPQPSLGILISDGYGNLTIYPYQLVVPVLILSALMLCFNLLADGLRDAMDPKMKGR